MSIILGNSELSIRTIWRDFKNEHPAFWFLCVYLIFEYNKPQTIYPWIDIIPWGKVLLILALFFAVLDKKSTAPPSSAVWPMVYFSFAVSLSMLMAFSTAIAFNHWIDYFSWVFVVLLITGVVTTRQRLFLFMLVYFLVNLKMAQHGFISWMLRGFSFAGWGVSGSPGWFQNSGEFSMEMCVFLPWVLSYIAFYRQKLSRPARVVLYAIVVMAIGSIIASNSRGSVLGLVAVGLWGLTYSRERLKALVAVAAVSFLVYTFIPVQFKARFERAGEDVTSLSRIAYWECGVQAVKENPFVGVGFKNWNSWVTVNHPEIIGLNSAHKEAEVIHNTYLEAATELGLIGATLYLLMSLQIFVSNRRSARTAAEAGDRFLEATAVGLTGSLFGYLVPSYFMSVLYYPYIWILLAFSVSLSNVCRQAVIHGHVED